MNLILAGGESQGPNPTEPGHQGTKGRWDQSMGHQSQETRVRWGAAEGQQCVCLRGGRGVLGGGMEEGERISVSSGLESIC